MASLLPPVCLCFSLRPFSHLYLRQTSVLFQRLSDQTLVLKAGDNTSVLFFFNNLGAI